MFIHTAVTQTAAAAAAAALVSISGAQETKSKLYNVGPCMLWKQSLALHPPAKTTLTKDDKASLCTSCSLV